MSASTNNNGVFLQFRFHSHSGRLIMPDSLSLPLRPLIDKREHQDSLPVEIAQINAQWGAFRDVSEDSLRAQIEADKHKDPWAEDEESDGQSAADVDTSERLEQLYKRRAEITNFAL